MCCSPFILNDIAKGHSHYMLEFNHLLVKNKYEYSYYYQTGYVQILIKTHNKKDIYY